MLDEAEEVARQHGKDRQVPSCVCTQSCTYIANVFVHHTSGLALFPDWKSLAGRNYLWKLKVMLPWV